MSSSYWCYQCNRSVRLHHGVDLRCPLCDDGFLEEMSAFLAPPAFVSTDSHPLAEALLVAVSRRSRRRRRTIEERRNDTLIQILEATFGSGAGLRSLENGEASEDREDMPGFLPVEQSEVDHQDAGMLVNLEDVRDFFVHSGLDQFLQGTSEPNSGSLPASRAAIDAMPTLKITKQTLESDEIHCAVCKEIFEVGGDVREMPCKHIYHSGCILPWLELHSSCPVCRHEMPTEDSNTWEHLSPSAERASEPGLDVFDLPGLGVRVRSFTLWGTGDEQPETQDVPMENDRMYIASSDLETTSPASNADLEIDYLEAIRSEAESVSAVCNDILEHDLTESSSSEIERSSTVWEDSLLSMESMASSRSEVDSAMPDASWTSVVQDGMMAGPSDTTYRFSTDHRSWSPSRDFEGGSGRRGVQLWPFRHSNTLSPWEQYEEPEADNGHVRRASRGRDRSWWFGPS